MDYSTRSTSKRIPTVLFELIFFISDIQQIDPLINILFWVELNTLSDREEIIKIVERFFETGKSKDLQTLKQIQFDSSDFSSFSDVLPYDLKDFKTTIALEELRFVSISD